MSRLVKPPGAWALTDGRWRGRSNDLTAGVRACAQLLTDTQQGIRGSAELVGSTVANTLLPAVKGRVLAEQGARPPAARAGCTSRLLPSPLMLILLRQTSKHLLLLTCACTGQCRIVTAQELMFINA